MHFEVRASPLSSIVCSLVVLSNLRSLTVFFPCDDDLSDPPEQPIHSNIDNLKIFTEDSDNALGILDYEMGNLFDALVLPRLHTLSIASLEAWETNQEVPGWWAIQLPSLMSRSSALLKSFSLTNVWIPVGNLISLLQQL